MTETNHNLHTFEFMLGQYRQMAKISPFLVKASEEAATSASLGGIGSMSKSESNLSLKGNEEVIEQLKVLSDAIKMMKISSAEVVDDVISKSSNATDKQNEIKHVSQGKRVSPF